MMCNDDTAIDEWRKRRESGQISDLENQYGEPGEKKGGIPFPMASFGGELYNVFALLILYYENACQTFLGEYLIVYSLFNVH